MRLLKLFAATLAVSMLAACSSSNERWSNFDNQSANVNPKKNYASLVVYRTDVQKNPNAVTVNLNGEYLSSLQSGGFAKTEICVKPTALEAQYVAMKPSVKHQLTPVSQAVYYFQIIATDAHKPQIKEVDATTAQTALKTLRHQANTLSRVTLNCTSH